MPLIKQPVIDSNVDAIKAKTDLIPADITAQLNTNVPAIKAKTDLIPADNVTQIDTNIPAIKAKTDLIPASPATEGTSTAIKAKTDALPTDPADESLVEAAITTAHATTDAAISTRATPADVEGKVENAEDSGNLTHDITTVNDLTETQMVEIAKAGIYALSIYIDLDVLETAVEGGLVKIRLYNKIDGTNYSDKPSAYVEYTVGSENEYPSIEVNMVHGYCNLTIQCSTDVTVTRTIAYRYIVRDLGA